MTHDPWACPSDLWVLVPDQVWARIDPDGHCTVGITALGMHLAGDVYMCRPKAVGSDVQQGRGVAVVELAKSIVSVKSPISGRVMDVNPRLAAHPELLQQAPYGDGWLARVRPSDLTADRAALLQGEPLATAMANHAWLHRSSP